MQFTIEQGESFIFKDFRFRLKGVMGRGIFESMDSHTKVDRYRSFGMEALVVVCRAGSNCQYIDTLCLELDHRKKFSGVTITLNDFCPAGENVKFVFNLEENQATVASL
jgi:hypothetical protein